MQIWKMTQLSNYSIWDVGDDRLLITTEFNVLKRSFLTIVFCCISGAASAGGALKYTATDADGTIERIVNLRDLAGGKIGAIASYTRRDGSSSFVEYAVGCEPLSFAYLGIVTYDKPATPNLLTLRKASNKLLSNSARPVQMIALGNDSGESAVQSLANAVCS